MRQRRKTKDNWELMSRMPTQQNAWHVAELLMSVPHAKKAKRTKEGRGFSVYIHYVKPKIKRWGYGRLLK